MCSLLEVQKPDADDSSYIILHLERHPFWDCLKNSFLATLPLLLPSAYFPPLSASCLSCTGQTLWEFD